MKKILFVLGLCFFAGICFAQQSSQATKSTQKVKPPKLTTLWGKYKDSVALPLEEVQSLLETPLAITGANKEQITLSSFQLLLRSRAVTEDEEGNAKPTTAAYAKRFYSFPLPQVWIDNLHEKVNKGSEIMFYDIIVKDKNGKAFLAPIVKVTVL